MTDRLIKIHLPSTTVYRDLMEGQKEMSSQDAGKLVEMAKELGGRFSRTFR